MGGLFGRIQMGGSTGVFARTGEPPSAPASSAGQAFGSFPPGALTPEFRALIPPIPVPD